MVIVSKFGGTSVGSAKNMKMVAEIIRGQKCRITVLSAMSGTTDALVKISKLASRQDPENEIPATVAMLREKYSGCINELLPSPQAALDKMEEVFTLIQTQARHFAEYSSERTILAQGELLTSFIFNEYLKSCSVKSALLNAPDFVVTTPEGKVDTKGLNEKLAALTKDTHTFYVTQGFICTDSEGRLDNLGRGGSDYSAAMFGAAIGADEVQIWTDIDGMHNNDPRFVENTRPIRKMSFDEAAELAYFGAKILHPATIQPCKDMNIPVMLKNTMQPEAPGTKISNEESSEGGNFHAVAAKDGITVIRIHSARMLMAYGFLRKVFEVFEQHKTPIDMITTSEVAVSLTIDSDCHLDAIVAELQSLGSIEIEKNNTIVCVVGDMAYERTGLGARLFDSLAGVPIKMISYGASERSVAILVDTQYKKQTLQSLSSGIFE